MEHGDSFRTARLVRLVNLFLQAILFVTLFAGLNYVALNHGWRFDLSAHRRFALSAETQAYIASLAEPVRIVVTISDDGSNPDLTQARRDLTALLREYVYEASRNPNAPITVEHLDVYQQRQRAEALGIDQVNAVVLLSGPRKHAMTLGEFYRIQKGRRDEFLGEAALTAGLLTVTKPDKDKIYFVDGHSEMQPDDTKPGRGLSQFRDELRLRNFDLARLNLSIAQKIPDDAALLVVPAPQGRFTKYEEDLLRSYMQTRAGRVIILLDPGRPHGLENLFFEWGVLVYDNLVVDLDNLTATGDMVLRHYADDPLTLTLRQADDKPVVGASRVVSEEPGRGADDGLRVRTLLATGKGAWGETNYRDPTARPEYTSGQDLRGHLGVVAISERLKPGNLPLSVRGGRLAVIGTGDLVSNIRINTTANFRLMLQLVNWAVERGTEVNIPARPIPRYQLALTQEEISRLRLALFLVVPGLTAALGLLVYWTRRN
jgi:ABC-type uncharacterized transport system